MSLTRSHIQLKYPEVYESYILQLTLSDSKYEEKLKNWKDCNINCFSRWMVPYFLERERERKRPCLRLNYPVNGKCDECVRGTCRYDKVCFMCGQEGHGAFQTFPGGKLKGELKCQKHRHFLNQMEAIRASYDLDEEDIRDIFTPNKASTVKPKAGASTTSTTATSISSAGGGTVAAPTAAGVGTEGAVVAVVTTKASKDSSSLPLNQWSNSSTLIKNPPVTSTHVSGTTAIAAARSGETSASVSGSSSQASSSPPSPMLQPQSSPAVVMPGSPSTTSSGNTTTASINGSESALSYSSPMRQQPQPHALLQQQPPLLQLHQQSPMQQSQGNGNGSQILQQQHQPTLQQPHRQQHQHQQQYQQQPQQLQHQPRESDVWGTLSSPTPASPSVRQRGGFENVVISDSIFASSGWGSVANTMASPQQKQHAGTLGELNSASSLLSSTGSIGALGGTNSYLPLPPSQHLPFPSSTGALANGFAPGLSVSSSPSPQSTSSLLPAPITYEIIDGDEFGGGSVLQFSLVSVLKDSQGTNGIFYKGSIGSNRGSEDVVIYAWRKNSLIDMVSLRQEVKVLRLLAATSNNMVARIMHRGSLDFPANALTGGVELSAIATEYSELGCLENYLKSYKHMHPEGFSTTDLQSFSCQLMDAIIRCHGAKISHRNISPASVLVSRGAQFQTNQSLSGIVLKLSDFRLCSLAALAQETELDRWVAPEVEMASRSTGISYQFHSDAWSIGLVLYALATGGQCPFDSHRQAVDACSDDSVRMACINKHNLNVSIPMLYDLIERLLRPVHTRASLALVRCHPFLWSTNTRKKYIIDFTDTLTSTQQRRSENMDKFVSSFNHYAPKFVFGEDGWCVKMRAEYLPFVNPQALRIDYWLSGLHLLQAIRNQIAFLDPLRTALYSRHTPHQALVVYLKQTVDSDFPRLLVLIFELGILYGRWDWDGDETIFTWK